MKQNSYLICELLLNAEVGDWKSKKLKFNLLKQKLNLQTILHKSKLINEMPITED